MRRITGIANELANQISELSGDIDTLQQREPLTEEAVGELVDNVPRRTNPSRQRAGQVPDRLPPRPGHPRRTPPPPHNLTRNRAR